MMKKERSVENTIDNNNEMRAKNYIPKVLPSSKEKIDQYYPVLWVERPKPIEGESLSSWMIRTALANLEKVSSLTGEVGSYPSHIDFDLKWIPEVINYFSVNTETSEEELREMSYCDLLESFNKFNHKNRFSFKDLWFTGWRKRAENGLRICPICLKEDDKPFLRKQWRLSYIPFCFKHGCFLENQCPECDSPIAPYELKWDSELSKCFKCGSDLTKIRPLMISNIDSILVSYRSFINNNKTEEICEILVLSWFIANHCLFSNDIYKNHPLAKSEAIINLENNNLNNPNKKSYFQNPQAIYLLVGIAIKLFQNSELLKAFLLKYHTSRELIWRDKPFKCPEKDCDFTEASFARMEIHIRRHKDERLYKCEKCKKEFVTNWDFKKHLKIHDEPHPFECPVTDCNMRFRYEKQYIHHLRTIHNIKPYICKICNKTFKRNYNLETHIRTHTGIKPYICKQCGKGFTQKSALTVHIRTHTGKKPYVCSVCGKGFSQSHSLTEHLRIHTDDRPYVCSECGKGFKRKHHLDNHFRTHTGEKPFKCSKCKKAFADKGNLNKHMTVHSEERKYTCTICGKSYKYSSGLSKHKKKEHQF